MLNFIALEVSCNARPVGTSEFPWLACALLWTIYFIAAIQTVTVTIASPGCMNTIVVSTSEFFTVAWGKSRCNTSDLVTVVMTIGITIAAPSLGNAPRIVADKLIGSTGYLCTVSLFIRVVTTVVVLITHPACSDALSIFASEFICH